MKGGQRVQQQAPVNSFEYRLEALRRAMIVREILLGNFTAPIGSNICTLSRVRNLPCCPPESSGWRNSPCMSFELIGALVGALSFCWVGWMYVCKWLLVFLTVLIHSEHQPLSTHRNCFHDLEDLHSTSG